LEITGFSSFLIKPSMLVQNCTCFQEERSWGGVPLFVLRFHFTISQNSVRFSHIAILLPKTMLGIEKDRRHTVAYSATSSGGGISNLILGGVIQMGEAATLGMPFEVWKTRMGRFRTETTIESFKNIYSNGGAKAFWNGLGPKMVESASKGAILLYAKEGINDSLLTSGVNPVMAGLLAGAGGGVAQVVVMGPCTFLVTAAVTSGSKMSTTARIADTFRTNGIKGFYPGGTAIAFRQATNWASRQGFTELVRSQFKMVFHNDANAKLTKLEEIGAGVLGGALSCWNHPFEVARIEMQASAASNSGKSVSMVQVFENVVKENGIKGLFQGVVPRIGLGVWQTLCLVVFSRMIKETMQEQGIIE